MTPKCYKIPCKLKLQSKTDEIFERAIFLRSPPINTGENICRFDISSYLLWISLTWSYRLFIYKTVVIYCCLTWGRCTILTFEAVGTCSVKGKDKFSNSQITTNLFLFLKRLSPKFIIVCSKVFLKKALMRLYKIVSEKNP